MPSCPAGMKKPFSIIFYVKSETFGKLGGQYEILSNIKFLLKIYLCFQDSQNLGPYLRVLQENRTAQTISMHMLFLTALTITINQG